MPLLIATDEAGYGPKLGPLVIVAAAWEWARELSDEIAFAPLTIPIDDARCGSVYVDDSKRVFKKQRQASSTMRSLPMTDIVCQAASQWAGLPDPLYRFEEWLNVVAPSDWNSILESPWFAAWGKMIPNGRLARGQDFNDTIINHWSVNGIRLCGVKARCITASSFNSLVDQGANKADILTDSTCRLAVELLDIHGTDHADTVVYSDRHGGRAYYGAVLQHHFDGALPLIECEGKGVSRYRLSLPHSTRARNVTWSFTVKGDSFAPVAMSSMIAKWLRERAMDRFNEFFSSRLLAPETLAPTAGYPTDADRFIADLRRLGLDQGIDDQQLIRKR